MNITITDGTLYMTGTDYRDKVLLLTLEHLYYQMPTDLNPLVEGISDAFEDYVKKHRKELNACIWNEEGKE